MLIPWWLQLIDGLGHYVIRQRKIELVMVMTNNIITLGYTYEKHRLKTPPGIFCNITQTVGLIEWIP